MVKIPEYISTRPVRKYNKVHKTCLFLFNTFVQLTHLAPINFTQKAGAAFFCLLCFKVNKSTANMTTGAYFLPSGTHSSTSCWTNTVGSCAIQQDLLVKGTQNYLFVC